MGSIRLRTFTRRIAESRNRHKNHLTSESTSRLKKERERVQTQRGEVRKLLHGKKEFRYSRINNQKSRRYRLNKISKSPTWCSRVLTLCLKSSLKKLLWLEWHSYIYLRRHSSLFPLASFSHQFSHRVHTGFHSLEGSKVTLEFPLLSFHSFFTVSNFP